MLPEGCFICCQLTLCISWAEVLFQTPDAAFQLCLLNAINVSLMVSVALNIARLCSTAPQSLMKGGLGVSLSLILFAAVAGGESVSYAG